MSAQTSVASTEGIDEDSARIAARVQAIVDARGADGSYRYDDDEVRDFICAAVFELGLPMTPELDAVVQRFLARLGLPANASPDELFVVVRAYFQEHPLNPHLSRELAAFGRSELTGDGGGFERRARANASRIAAGLSTKIVAPLFAPVPASSKLPVRRGLH